MLFEIEQDVILLLRSLDLSLQSLNFCILGLKHTFFFVQD